MELKLANGEKIVVEVSSLEVTVAGQGDQGLIPPGFKKSNNFPPFVHVNPEDSGSIATLFYVANREIDSKTRASVGATSPQAFYVLHLGGHIYQLDFKGTIVDGIKVK